MASCWRQYMEPTAARRRQRPPDSVVAAHCGRCCADAFFFVGTAFVAAKALSGTAFVAAADFCPAAWQTATASSNDAMTMAFFTSRLPSPSSRPPRRQG